MILIKSYISFYNKNINNTFNLIWISKKIIMKIFKMKIKIKFYFFSKLINIHGVKYFHIT